MKIHQKQGDTVTISETFERASDGGALDLSDAQSVKIFVDHPSSGDLVVNDEVEIIDATAGQIEYELSGTQTARQGRHRVEFVAQFADGATFTFPRSGFISLNLSEPIDRELPVEELADGDVSVTTLFADAISANSADAVSVQDDLVLEDNLVRQVGEPVESDDAARLVDINDLATVLGADIDDVEDALDGHVADTDNPHATTLESARAQNDTLEGDVDFDGNGAKSLGALEAGSLSTERASFGMQEEWRIVDSESEFADALNELGDGGLIMPTANVEVESDYSFDSNLTIIGPSAARGEFPEAWISSNAELTANGRIAIANSSIGECTIVINGSRSSVVGTNARTESVLEVNNDYFRCVAFTDGAVEFADGTKDGVVDGSTSVSVTDNGDNTVGDVT